MPHLFPAPTFRGLQPREQLPQPPPSQSGNALAPAVAQKEGACSPTLPVGWGWGAVDRPRAQRCPCSATEVGAYENSCSGCKVVSVGRHEVEEGGGGAGWRRTDSFIPPPPPRVSWAFKRFIMGPGSAFSHHRPGEAPTHTLPPPHPPSWGPESFRG